MDPNLARILKNIGWALLFIGIAIFVVWKASTEEDDSPCSRSHYPGSCYQVDKEVCGKEWATFADECRKQIDALNLPPARLTGPIMDRCQKSKYDRMFHYVRRQSSACNSEIQELEAWRKSNPDF